MLPYKAYINQLICYYQSLSSILNKKCMKKLEIHGIASLLSETFPQQVFLRNNFQGNNNYNMNINKLKLSYHNLHVHCRSNFS